jgi:hypothetical protein
MSENYEYADEHGTVVCAAEVVHTILQNLPDEVTGEIVPTIVPPGYEIFLSKSRYKHLLEQGVVKASDWWEREIAEKDAERAYLEAMREKALAEGRTPPDYVPPPAEGYESALAALRSSPGSEPAPAVENATEGKGEAAEVKPATKANKKETLARLAELAKAEGK